MGNKLPINEFQENFVTELQRLNYGRSAMSKYRNMSEELVNYAEKQGIKHYTVDFGQQFLEEMYPTEKNESSAQWTVKQWDSRRTLRLLDDFNVNGIITLRRQTGDTGLSDSDAALLGNYRKYLTNHGYADGTRNDKAHIARRFLRYLSGKQRKVSEITENDIVDYLNSESSLAKSTRSSIIYSTKRFLNYLYSEKLIITDFIPFLPKGHATGLANIVSVWEPGNLEKLLGAIDRGSPLGKRDYAIILIATKLGLRTVDIFGLRKEHINWKESRIEIVQSKTGQPLSHSLPEDIGWAIIDYLKYGRPASDSSFVFLSHHPHKLGEQLTGSFQATVTKYVRQAGIRLGGEQKLGLHSMRHTLACRLLEAKTPLHEISGILGQTSPDAIEKYLKVNVESLRECALNPEDVFEYAADN